MILQWLDRYKAIISVMLVLALWSAAFAFLPIDAYVDSIGIQYAYVVSFFITLFAGFSIFTGSTAYAAVISFARAGANPLLLGVVSGIALFLSDSVFYYLILRGRNSVETHFHAFFVRMQQWIERLPTPVVYTIIYLFCAFGPIPNDAIIAMLIIAGYEYRKFWPLMLAGDMTFMLFLTYIFKL